VEKQGVAPLFSNIYLVITNLNYYSPMVNQSQFIDGETSFHVFQRIISHWKHDALQNAKLVSPSINCDWFTCRHLCGL